MLEPLRMGDMPHLLLVDDARSIREPLAMYLGKQGFRVTQAGDAAAARHRLAAEDRRTRTGRPRGRVGAIVDRRVLPAPRAGHAPAPGVDPRPVARPDPGPRSRGVRSGDR